MNHAPRWMIVSACVLVFLFGMALCWRYWIAPETTTSTSTPPVTNAAYLFDTSQVMTNSGSSIATTNAYWLDTTNAYHLYDAIKRRHDEEHTSQEIIIAQADTNLVHRGLEIDTPQDKPATLTLWMANTNILEICNLAVDTNRPPDVAWIDPTPTNLLIRLYQRPMLVETGGVWVITFPPDRIPFTAPRKPLSKDDSDLIDQSILTPRQFLEREQKD